MRKTMMAVSVAALMMGGSSALASTLYIEKQNSSNTFNGNGNVSVQVKDTARVETVGARAGGFALKEASLKDFVAWCLDITTTLKLPGHYRVPDSPFTATTGEISETRLGDIQKLFDTGYDTTKLGNNDYSAGFQLALWEIIYETDMDAGSVVYDVTAGTFFQNKSGSAQDDAEEAANTLLGGLSGSPVDKRFNLVFLESLSEDNDGRRSQNLVTVTPVPLPAAGLLLIAGLGGLAMARRRA